MAPTYAEQLEHVKDQLDSIAVAIEKDNLKADVLVRQVLTNLRKIETDMENLHLPTGTPR